MGQRLTLGHAHGGRADVPLLGDLGPRAMELVHGETFHGGAFWSARSLLGADEDGAEGQATARPLVHREELAVTSQVVLRFLQPDPSSAAAVLELLGTVEAEGARRVLLVPPGPQGRVRIGATRDCHWPLAGLEKEVDLWLEPSGDGLALRVKCAAVEPVPGAESPTQKQPAGVDLCRPFPPERREDWVLGARSDGSGAIGLSISPLDPPTILPRQG